MILALPPTPYGREAQVAQLEALVRQAVGGQACTVLITGPAGIGKSALVQALRQRMAGGPALYAEGKHDPRRRHLPFNAFNQAFEGLIRNAPPARLEAWKRRVRETVGGLGGALAAAVPAVAQLIGEQPAALQLEPRANRDRLLWLLPRFVRALAAEQPLVLFLDDLQWADSGSLSLLARLDGPSPEGGGLLVVAAYRSDEVMREHPLTQSLLHMTAARAQAGMPPLPHLQLEALEPAAIAQWVSDATGASAEQARPLAAWLHSQTAGNPLFVRQLMHALWHRGLVAYDRDSQRWAWDLPAIHSANLPNDVMDLLTGRLGALTEDEAYALSAAACIGLEFAAEDLAALLARPPRQAMAALQTALQSGLLTPAGEIAGGSGGDGSNGGVARLRFTHDRVREAAYSMLAPEGAEDLHHRLGMALWAAHRNAAPGPWLLTCLDHLNRAPEALTNGDLRIDVAALNLAGAQQAHRAAAYAAAHTCLQHALALLPGDAWERHYALIRDIELLLAESEAISGQRAQAVARLDTVLTRARSASERALVQRQRARWLSGELLLTVDFGAAPEPER